MSTIGKQMMIYICVAIVLFLLSMAMFIYAYPIANWTLLWKQNLFNVPFLLIAPSIIVLLAMFVGLSSGLAIKKQFNTIEDSLHELEQGQHIQIQETNVPELKSITYRIEKLQKQMLEQTKQSQKLATEKAEDQEKRIQEIVSQERNRLARELHDSVSQQLFAASMMMSAIAETRVDQESRETKQLQMVEQMIHQSQLEMRALLLHLRPVALKGKLLHEGIEELLTELLQKVPMEIKWKVESLTLPKGIEDHLFRILQESISNTLRHSKANSLEVLLVKRDDLIILRVVDDGIGFDVETSKAGSYGLNNMYERALEIGGTFKIISLQNKGTRLEVKVPSMTLEGDIVD